MSKKLLNPNHITAQTITDHKYTHIMQASWTWNVGNYATAEAYIQHKLENPNTNFYWIMHNNQCVAFTGTLPHPDYQHMQTSTLITIPYRNTNLNTIIKHSIAKACQQTQQTIIATVDINNIPSWKSLNKITNTNVYTIGGLGNYRGKTDWPTINRTKPPTDLTKTAGENHQTPGY